MNKEIFVKIEKDDEGTRHPIVYNNENSMNKDDKYGVYVLKEMRIMKMECKPVKCS
jgi:hypothetical protein